MMRKSKVLRFLSASFKDFISESDKVKSKTCEDDVIKNDIKSLIKAHSLTPKFSSILVLDPLLGMTTMSC